MRSDLETIYKREIRGYFGDCSYSSAISSSFSSSYGCSSLQKRVREEEERGHTLFDIRYYITQLHLLHALMLSIPMVLLVLELGGHVGISVPAISSLIFSLPLLTSLHLNWTSINLVHSSLPFLPLPLYRIMSRK
jgi:hypothetical protein